MCASRVKIGLVQINNSFSGQNYFPYSVGIFQAFAKEHLKRADDFEFLPPVYSRIRLEDAVMRLADADIVFFSAYVWNTNISMKIAEEIKKGKDNPVVVFGGPSVPDKIENFMRQHAFIDIACHGEGETSFLSILENYKARDWSKVPSVSYIDTGGNIVQNPECERISDLNMIPSPYLTGVFDPLMRSNPAEIWLALWETNRGCPFSCTFCDWGSKVHNKIYAYDLERIFKEVDWFSENRIEFVYCCDANFGILPRDIEIVKYVAGNKKRYSYPKVLSVQNTKNLTEHSYKIQKIMAEAGLNKGVTLSLQSTNKDTLKSVKRSNISLEVFQELQKRFMMDNITTYTDVILGLPDETYDTFKNGVSQLIENGQHNRIQFNNLSALPNSEMSDLGYQEKYGLVTRETKIINLHGSLASSDEIRETQILVVGTNTMPKADWVKARAFGWMTSLLYFDKILQVPLIVLHDVFRVSFRELLEFFAEGETGSSIIFEMRSFFVNRARDLQNGGAEYCHSKEWLNIWWPDDELILIKLCAEGRLKAFYEEAKQEILRFLNKKNLELPSGLLDELIYLNHNLIKLPFQYSDFPIRLSYNIPEVYKATLRGISVLIEKGSYNYLIERENAAWSSWEEWCKKVIWYENKKGAYLYNCKDTAKVEIDEIHRAAF